MTWCKLGTEFFDQLVDSDFPADIDDACQLTHTQSLHYLYSVEAMDMRFKKSVLRRFATSSKSVEAAHALVKAGVWADHGNEYEVIHHGDVFRHSLYAQQKKKEGNKERQRKYRARAAEGDDDNGGPTGGQPGVTQEVTPSVARDVTRDVTDTADRQTDIQTAATEREAEFDQQTGELVNPEEYVHDVRTAGAHRAAESESERSPSGHPPSSPPSSADPWAEPGETCSHSNCAQRLDSAYLRNLGYCTNHVHLANSKSKKVA